MRPPGSIPADALWDVVLPIAADEKSGASGLAQIHRDVIGHVVRLDPEAVLMVEDERSVDPWNGLICI